MKETKEEAKRQQQQQERQKQLKGTGIFMTVVALLVGGSLFYLNQQQHGGGNRLGGGSSSGGIDQTRRLQEIQAQRQRAEAEMMKQALEAKQQGKNGGRTPPSWQEQEAKEVWTSKQIKQFDNALIAFGGVPPKARYGLIADKVDGKTRNECLLHHKYIEWLKTKQTDESKEGNETEK